MVAVPADTAVTKPLAASTLATALLVVPHTPPVPVVESVAVVPAHKVVVPDITPALAALLTVTVAVALAVPQLLVTE